MVKKTKSSPRTAKGAVLIMVLTIMFVLIFLLAGTIAVVYSSHNAALNKYKQSQAYYTSRSLLDTFIFTFLKDDVVYVGKDGFGHEVTYYSIDMTTATPTLKSTTNTTQGRALELDIYSLGVDLQTDVDGVQTVFDLDNHKAPEWAIEYILQVATNDEAIVEHLIAEAKAAGQSHPSDKTDAEWATAIYKAKGTDYEDKYKEALYVAELLINPRVGKSGDSDPTAEGFDNPLPAIADDPIEYRGTDDSGNNYKHYYNQFIPKDINNNLVSDTTSANKIVDTLTYKVKGNELVSMAQTISNGSYKIIDSDPSDSDPNCNAYIYVKILERKYNIGGGESFKERFDSGNREQDYVKLLITCVSPYDGRFSETSVIYNTTYSPAPSNNNALTALGNIDASTSGFQIGGGFSSLNSDTVNLDANQATVGAIFTYGGLQLNTSGGVKLPDNQSMTVLGDLTSRNLQTITATDDNSFIYVGGTLDANNQIMVGDTNHNINVLANTVSKPSSNELQIKGNLYADRIMYNTSNNGKIQVSEKIYVNILEVDSSMLETNPPTTDGSGKTMLKLKSISNNTTPIYVADTVVIKNAQAGSGNSVDSVYGVSGYGWTDRDLIYRQSTTPFVFDPSNGTNYIVSSTPVQLGYRNADHYNNELDSNFRKVFTMPDDTTYNVDTIRSKYKTYYTEECFVTEDPSRTGTLGDFKDGFDPLNAADIGGVITAEQKASVYTGSNSCYLPGAVAIASNSAIGGGNYILPASNVGTVTINSTTTQKTVIQLADTGGTYAGNINITGDGDVIFLIPENGKDYNFGDGGSNLLINYELSKIELDKKIYVGKVDPNKPTTPPEVDIIIGGNSKVTVNRDSFITGYIYGPKAAVEVNTNAHGRNILYTESGASANGGYWLAGSCLCKSYKNANVGVAFVPRDVETIEDGFSIFKWVDVLYTRG